MATLAEQNAVRCKEAGNVLYKSERYEEVSSEQYIYVCFLCVFACACLPFFRRSLFSFSFDDADFFPKCEKRACAFVMNALSLSLFLLRADACFFINNTTS